MNVKIQSEAFLAQKRIAVVGVSRNQGTGNSILKALQGRGYEVVPVNPNAAEVEGQKCYPNLKEIPSGVNAVVIVTNPEVTKNVAQECVEVGVDHVWMHFNAMFGESNSSVSEEAAEYCRQNGINVIAGGCPLMFGEGADFGHKCMRWLLGVTGKLP